jgi:heme/copper-type cytochrome/quinol oxidase subunit 2
MTVRRLAVLQWVGLVLGAVVWAGQHLAGWGLTEATCDSGNVAWSIQHDLWQALLMAAAIALVLVAEAAAVAVFRETGGASYEDAAPLGRLRFFAIAAMAANVIFLMIILLDGLAAIFNVACRQA